MKAKDYADALIVRSQAKSEELKASPAGISEALVRLGAHSCIEILRETQVAVRKTKTLPSMYGAFREGLSKWKAVVRLVHAVLPDHPVTVNYLGLFIASDKPEAFEALVANKVFLGYEFCSKEQEILDDLKSKRFAASQASSFDQNLSWLVNRLLGGLK